MPVPLAAVDINVFVHTGDAKDPLHEVLRLVRLIRTDIGALMASEAELDAALTQLSTDLAEVASDLSAAIGRVEAALAAQGVDLTDELAAVQAASTGLDAVSAGLQGLVPETPPA